MQRRTNRWKIWNARSQLLRDVIHSAAMRFAKIVFRAAAIWGVLIITPLYAMFDLIGRQDPPPITHPAFFYGFVGLALAWQIAFFFIAGDPVRYRPLMIPSMFEKFSYAAAVVILVLQARTRRSDLLFAGTDLLLGVLFVIAYFKTSIPHEIPKAGD